MEQISAKSKKKKLKLILRVNSFISMDRGKSIRNYDKMLTLAYLKNQ